MLLEHDVNETSDYARKLENDRRDKVAAIRSLGFDPYGMKSDNKYRLIALVRLDAENAEEPTAESRDGTKKGQMVFVAGRLVSKNNKGKLKFFHLQDATNSIQLMFSKSNFNVDWELVQEFDVNDIIGVSGILMKTQTGEITVYVETCKIFCKSLASPPEKFHGIKDEEIQIRQRYLDMVQNQKLTGRLQDRSEIIRIIREFLQTLGFIEVETPILSNQALGAAAKPFTTHHNALDIPLYLRIAPELHLKRYLVGGFPKVFEIGKVFRNEGIDRTHNPEFTMLELYEAYGNVDTMRVYVELLLQKLYVTFGMEYWPQAYNYQSLFEFKLKLDIFDEEAVRKFAGRTGDHWELVDDIFDKHLQPEFIDPTFVYNYPAPMCPLAKPLGDKRFCGRFELFIQGMEIANAYTELNDPDLQLENFKKQGSDAIDYDFIEALKLGMPAAGGLGIGIDRLVMLLTKAESIRDVIAFPLVRPKSCF